MSAVDSVWNKRSRERKKARIVMSLVGMAVGFLVAQLFKAAGFWSFGAGAWGWLLALAVLVHGALWLVLRLGWDAYLKWDPHFLYVPWASVIALFCLFVWVVPAARVLIPFGYFINLMFLVGLAGFREVLGFSMLMSGGYLATIALLRSRGEPVSLGYEALIAGLLLALSGFAGTVLEQAKKRKQATLHGAAELRKLSRAVEQSSSLVLITDVDGKIEYVNPKFSIATGYSAAEVIGKTPAILKSGDTPAEAYQELWNTISSGLEWQGEFKNLSKSGRPYWVLASISPVRDHDGVITHFIGVEEDITEKKHVEAQLVQAQKMEGVGQLVSGVAHDFNNLLTSVLGFAELALAKVEPNASVGTDLREIQKAGKAASALTRQLLAFSRQQMLRPVALDLNQVLREVDAILRRTVSEAIEIRTQLSPDLGPIRADPFQVQQVVMNLAVNARDAMPRGGVLIVETANAELGASYGDELVNVKPGQYVKLRVSDTGQGMNEETKRRVFEPFFTTKERGRGTGLGLATVYGIVKQSRGYIFVSSELGQGASFEVFLPRIEESVEAVMEPLSDEPRLTSVGEETVMLVEDDVIVRRLLSSALRSQGYRVLEAADAGKALSLSSGRGPDLLVTDVIMSGMNGVELADRIKAAHPGTKVLLMSGYAELGILEPRLDDPDTPFLPKPFPIKDFLKTVRELLDSPSERSTNAVSG